MRNREEETEGIPPSQLLGTTRSGQVTSCNFPVLEATQTSRLQIVFQRKSLKVQPKKTSVQLFELILYSRFKQDNAFFKKTAVLLECKKTIPLKKYTFFFHTVIKSYPCATLQWRCKAVFFCLFVFL